MTEFKIISGDQVVERISNKRQGASLVTGTAQQQSLEVLGGLWDGVFKKLSCRGCTLK
jgi:hypothetical protein